ncbi:hypothetical protein OAT10_02495 [Luminiphilus sp.]|nr:hypothetical protein [Luminiphilus sp.]
MIFLVDTDNKFCKLVHQTISDVVGEELPNLELLHKYVSVSEVNDVRLELFKRLNTDFNVNAAVISKPILQHLVTLLGPDVAIQTQINVSVHMPDDITSTLDAHSDTWSGETPFQLNFWLAVSDCESTGSIFILSEQETARFYSDMDASGECPPLGNLMAQRFIKFTTGEGVLFNSRLIHGNTTNNTERTRVSCNVRFKGLFHPESSDSGLATRARGNFFRPLTISKNSLYALRALGIDHEDPILVDCDVA